MECHNEFFNIRVTPTQDPLFNVDNCFDAAFGPEEIYIRDKDEYFNSYCHFGIHEEMLKDYSRTSAYEKAILRNSHLFKGKIVLDIGCGTGILSVFAARAGAKHVYGIEYASIAKHASKIVQENGFSDVITIMRGKVEEIELPVDSVDIIISEWMGYFLLYEAMLDTVIFARDKWLKPSGLMFPDKATIFVAGMEDFDFNKEKIEFWDDVYQVNMESVKNWVKLEPLVDIVNKSAINTDACPILSLDLQTCKTEDLDFSSAFSMTLIRNDTIHAIVGYFEVYFTHCHMPVKISTSAFANETHWKQTMFYLERPLKARKLETVYGSIAVMKDKKNKRELQMKLVCHLKHENGEIVGQPQFYKMT